MIELKQLVHGRFVYDEVWPAMDSVRFERILRGFELHYVISGQSGEHFSFARGEGYLKLDRLDAFASVDGGIVERLRDPATQTTEFGGNVVTMQPRFNALRYTLNVRVLMIYWMMAIAAFGFAIGGSWLLWLLGYIVAILITLMLVRLSLRRKIKRWLTRESWN